MKIIWQYLAVRKSTPFLTVYKNGVVMDIRKQNKTVYCFITLSMIICLCFAGVMSLFITKKSANAIFDVASHPDVGELLLDGYEGKSTIFDGDVLTKLYHRITGIENATIDNVESSGNKDGDDFRGYSVNSGKEIIVTIGKLKWNVVYLSKNRSEETILTLWLAESKQLPQDYNISQYNLYEDNYDGDYPANMYGTSMIRAVALNNGGTYYSSRNGDDPITVQPTADNPFAIYTMDNSSDFNGSITSYIDTPENVAWQEYLSARECNFFNGTNYTYNFPGDAYATTMTNLTGSAYDYQSKKGYSDWKYDKIWLPAMAETGFREKDATSDLRGLWKTSATQRGNDNGSDSSRTWLRSIYRQYSGAETLTGDGLEDNSKLSKEKHGVRPAFHLNLTKVAKSASASNPKTKGEAKKYYDQSATATFELENIDVSKTNINIKATDMDGKDITTEFTLTNALLTFKANQVGKYVVTVKPKDGEIWSDGSEEEKKYVYVLKYQLSPLMWAADVSSAVYRGEKEYYAVENYDADKIEVEVSNGGALEVIPTGEDSGKYGVSVVNAGEYTVSVRLKNTEYMEWSDGSSVLKTLAIEVGKRDIRAYTGTQWSTEVYTAKLYEVELAECYEGDIEKIRIEGYYRKRGSTEESKILSQITTKITEEKKKVAQVTLPRLAEQGEYECILRLAEGVEINGNYTMSFVNGFDVTNKRIDLKDEDIVWTYANHGISDEFIEIGEKDSEGVYNVNYNGEKYTFKVDITRLSSDVSESIEYEYVGGEESGSESNAEGAYYTARFSIKAKGGNTSITIVKDEFELRWRINKAKFDLSEVKWEYKGAYAFNEKRHSVALTGLPNGLEIEYSGNSGTNIGKYTAEAERVNIVDEGKKRNYIMPIPGQSETYIGEIEWSLEWEIVKGILELDWSRTLTKTDSNGRTFRYRAVSEEMENKLKGYVYYKDENGAPAGEAMSLDDIEVVPEQTDRYWAVAILADKWVDKYDISENSGRNRFTVGSTNEEVLIEMERKTFVYDGQGHGNEWKVVSGTENIIAKYYDRRSGEEIQGVPIDAGEYVVRFEIDPEYADGYELAVSEIEYEIVAAEIEWTLKGSPYTYDGKEHGIEIEISSDNYDAGKLILMYYRGNEVNAGNKLEGAPKDSGEYIMSVELSEEDKRNYILKSTQTGFRIDKRQISAVWNTSGSIPVLSDPEGKYVEVIGYIYYDENGNRLEDGATLEVGKRYKVQAIIKGEYGSNYEFIGEDGEVLAEATATEEKEFEVKDNAGGNGSGIGGIGSGDNNGEGNNSIGSVDFDKVIEILKNWWQVIASGVSIVLILMFTAKGIGYASKKKENRKTVESKYKTYYVTGGTGLFGLSMTNWTIIAGVLMGVAVLSLVFMIIEKKGYKKSVKELEDAKEEYARNREEMMFMRMNGNMQNGMGSQGFAYAGQGLGAEDIRGIVSETMTAMLPNVQQYLPQQASNNDELVQRLIEQNEQNEERIRQLTEENKETSRHNEEMMLQMMQKISEQPKEKEGVSEEVIERLVEKLSKQQQVERVAEKEVAATVANEEMLKELKETIREEIQSQMKAGAVEEEEQKESEETIKELSKSMAELKEIVEEMTRSEKREKEEKAGKEKVVERIVEVEKKEDRIEALTKTNERLMEKIIELSSSKGNDKPIIVQQPAPQIVEKEVRVEVPVEKIVEKTVPIEVEKVVEKIVEIPAVKPAPKAKTTAPRLTLDEAYAKLSAKQKKFFDTLKEYAMSKDKCKEKKSTYYILLGQSSVNPLVKLTIKKDCTVALFKMEDEYMKDIRRNAGSEGTKVKVKETELIVGDSQALATAKEMIDLREDQIERYNEYIKEQRSLKR